MTRKIRHRTRSVNSSETVTEEKTGPQNRELADPRDSDGGAPDAPGQEAGATVDDAKLQLLLIMKLQGRTQKEIATYFDVSDRTIRNWSKRLGGLVQAVADDLDPQSEIGAMLCEFTARKAELLEWKREAEEDGDRKAMRDFSKELRKLTKERHEFLKGLGLFHDLSLSSRSKGDASSKQARRLNELSHFFALVASARSEEDGSEEVRDD